MLIVGFKTLACFSHEFRQRTVLPCAGSIHWGQNRVQSTDLHFLRSLRVGLQELLEALLEFRELVSNMVGYADAVFHVGMELEH